MDIFIFLWTIVKRVHLEFAEFTCCYLSDRFELTSYFE